MNCSVNLVPLVHREQRARQRRRRAWLSVCVVLAVLSCAAWSVRHTADVALERRNQAGERLEQQRAEVQQRLVAAAARRTALLAQLDSVTGVRRQQPWPRRLLTLAREVPAGVLLTSLTIAPAGEAPGTRAGSAARTPASRAGEAVPPGSQDVRLQGYAVDHRELIEFLSLLQQLPGWAKVELVRAAAEPVGRGTAVAFELACRTQEDAT